MTKLKKLFTLSVLFIFTIQAYCQTFTVGSHKDEVLRIQGTPKTYNPNGFGNMEELEYNFSTVYISRSTQRVVKWTDISKVLKVRLLPGNNTTNLNYFTVGSHKDDVLRLQGTPKSYNPNALANMEELEYGYSTVYISRATSKVVKWTDISNVLKVRLGTDAEERLAEAISQKQKPQPETPKSVGNTNSGNKEIENNIRKLYDNLINSKKVTVEEIGNFETFNSMLKDSIKAVKLYQNLVKNNLFNESEIGTLVQYMSLVDPSVGLGSQIRTFKVEDKRYAIPLDKVEEFISNVPDCEEFVGFTIGDEKVDIPVLELPDFLENAKNPIARYNYPEFNVNLISSLINLKMLYEYLSGDNPLLKEHGYVNFVADMQNEENLLKVHKGVTIGKFFISYDIFNVLMKLDIPYIDKGNTGIDKLIYDLYKQSGVDYEPTEQDVKSIRENYNNDYRKFITDFYKQAAIDYDLTEDDFKSIETQYQLAQPNKINFEDFSGRIKEVYPEYKNMNDYILAETFVKKYPIYKNKVSFNNVSFLTQHEKENVELDDNKVKGLQLFYTDRINIGKIEIVLPVPSEFVRVDDMHQNQFDLAKLFVPKTNSLLALYLGERDFADLVSTGSHTGDKYIMVQIFNELKYQQVKSIAFQKYLRKFKNDYKIEFQESFKNGSFEAIQNIPVYFSRKVYQ
jgi:hypothetical protein